MSLDADIVEQLLYIDALRGEDSTGVCLIENDGDMRILKEATAADYFLRSKEWASVRTAYVSRGKAILGHNRKSTIGKTNDENAHPFVIDDRYVFMHNGTLHSHKHLADVEIDSHALGIHLTKCDGDPKKIEEALKTVYGAYACVWFDQKEEKIYMLKNKERPLYLAETSAGYIYASEPMFIYAACLRNKTKVEKCSEIENDTLYTFDISKFGITRSETKLEVKKSSPPATTYKSGGAVGQTNTPVSSMAFGKGGEVSKNGFKRFQQSAIGKRVRFWMDDYVERSYPTVDGNWLIWGTALGLEFNHSVNCYLSNTSMESLVENYEGRILSGEIETCTWERQGKSVNIYVKDIVVVPSSTAINEYSYGKTPAALH